MAKFTLNHVFLPCVFISRLLLLETTAWKQKVCEYQWENIRQCTVSASRVFFAVVGLSCRFRTWCFVEKSTNIRTKKSQKWAEAVKSCVRKIASGIGRFSQLSRPRVCRLCIGYWVYHDLNRTRLALVLFSQLSAAVVRHKANDGVVYAIRAWFKYDTALSAVV